MSVAFELEKALNFQIRLSSVLPVSLNPQDAFLGVRGTAQSQSLQPSHPAC